MSDFGVRLKQAREDRGISLRQIATATKISMAALEALERNDFSRLPGGIFSRAFVRAYALEVGLDPEQTVQQFLAEYERHGAGDAENAAPEVTADDLAFLERQRRAMRLLRNISIGVLVGLVALIVSWKLMTRSPATEPDPSAPTEAAPPRVTAAPPLPPVSAPPPGAARPVEPTPPAAASRSGVPKTDSDLVRLRLEITGECWVRVTVDGSVQIERVLQTGDTRDTTAGREIYVQVGNAGAVKWSINGRPAKDLGKPGETGTARVSRATMERYLQ